MSGGAEAGREVIAGAALGIHGTGREEIIVSCPSSAQVLSIINRRFVRIRCRHKWCRRADGARVYHIFDSVTGRLVDNELEYSDGRLVRASDPGGD